MATRLTLDQIVIPEGRTTAPDDDVSQLAVAMRDKGMKLPIIVAEIDHRFVLIDGLRRMEAARLLGHVTIDCFITDDLDLACAHLAKAHRNIKLPLRRIWEITRDLAPLVRLRSRRIKQRSGGGLHYRKDGDAPKTVLSRTLFSQATNAGSESLVDRLAQVYRWAPVELVQRMEAGELTVNQVLSLAKKRPTLDGHISKASEQEDLLTEAARNLKNTLRAIATVSRPLNVPHDRLKAIVKDMAASRAKLTVLTRALSEEMEQPK